MMKTFHLLSLTSGRRVWSSGEAAADQMHPGPATPPDGCCESRHVSDGGFLRHTLPTKTRGNPHDATPATDTFIELK